MAHPLVDEPEPEKLPRTEFERLTPEQQLAYMREDGKVIDDEEVDRPLRSKEEIREAAPFHENDE